VSFCIACLSAFGYFAALSAPALRAQAAATEPV
jgi:hypothetical protein